MNPRSSSLKPRGTLLPHRLRNPACAMVLVAGALAGPGSTQGNPAPVNSEPRQLLGPSVVRQTEIGDPVAAATRHHERVYTDARGSQGTAGAFALSPNGTFLAYGFDYSNRMTGAGGDSQVRVHRIGAPEPTAFAVRAWERAEQQGRYREYGMPLWDTKGTSLWFDAFMIHGDKVGLDRAVWSARPDGTGLRRRTPPSLQPLSPELSPDGRQLSYVALSSEDVSEGYGALRVLTLATGRVRTLVARGVYGRARWSPNGKWMVYGTGAHDRLFLLPSRGGVPRLLVTGSRLHPDPQVTRSPGKNSHYWLPDSRTLLFTVLGNQVSGKGSRVTEIWKVSLQGPPTRLAAGEVLAGTRDGRFLLLHLGGRYWRVELKVRTPSRPRKPMQ